MMQMTSNLHKKLLMLLIPRVWTSCAIKPAYYVEPPGRMVAFCQLLVRPVRTVTEMRLLLVLLLAPVRMYWVMNNLEIHSAVKKQLDYWAALTHPRRLNLLKMTSLPVAKWSKQSFVSPLKKNYPNDYRKLQKIVLLAQLKNKE